MNWSNMEANLRLRCPPAALRGSQDHQSEYQHKQSLFFSPVGLPMPGYSPQSLWNPCGTPFELLGSAPHLMQNQNALYGLGGFTSGAKPAGSSKEMPSVVTPTSHFPSSLKLLKATTLNMYSVAGDSSVKRNLLFGLNKVQIQHEQRLQNASSRFRMALHARFWQYRTLVTASFPPLAGSLRHLEGSRTNPEASENFGVSRGIRWQVNSNRKKPMKRQHLIQ
ncbi:hypothetical protein MUK42_28351 [Musa troglodytarum]|uniref:Uncharacterized protein n=1 Tax=Musa troglodytarum TaxID=320322 RepID=A0A9E7G5R8_9LILI|nr:hypothetical protein MUK42_28351 [Musa troglodytarum]